LASGAEQQLLEGRQLVAYLGGLLEIEGGGSRSGRTAYQFACDWAGRLPDERKVFE